MSSDAPPDVLFSAAEIAARVDAMAEEIAAGAGRDLIAVPILTGAVVFAADLMRALWHHGVAVEVMPIRLRSYGVSYHAETDPLLALGLDKRIDGMTALLIDGVCDAGHTLEHATAHLKEQGAARVLSAVLIDKPLRRAVAMAPDYVGFTADDVFVAGYGMDAAGRLRHLPYVGVVKA
jgi:hypoxanthine phosphoribosyltransferase